MQVHARISKEWRRRMITMFLMIFGSALWFLYDGFINWPAEAERYAVFKPLADGLVAEGKVEPKALKEAAKSPTLVSAWRPVALERGWKDKPPKERTPGAINGQRWTGWIMLAGAGIFAGWIAWNHTRSVRCEGEIITGASREKVLLENILEIDRRKWADKGIAYAIYEVAGKRQRLVLDDHKFIGCEAIIIEAEKRIAARAATAAVPAPPAT
jgi:hypothetical protein